MPNVILPEEDIVKIAPEVLEITNAYLKYWDIEVVANQFSIPVAQVSGIIQKPEVKRYIDSVFLNQGYRNRFKLAEVLDEILESKLEEARESETYTKKDMLEVIGMIHKIQDDHRKSSEKTGPKVQTNVQINDSSGQGFGEGNYGKLMEALINGKSSSTPS